MNQLLLAMLILPVAVAAGCFDRPYGDESPAPAGAVNLESYKWRNRLVLVFTPSAGQPTYEKQVALLKAEEPALVDRDIVVITVIGADSGRIGDDVLAEPDAAMLRRTFDVPAERFALILVGKDGTEKMRRRELTQPREIFQRIDAMPMRQEEMRRRREEEAQ